MQVPLKSSQDLSTIDTLVVSSSMDALANAQKGLGERALLVHAPLHKPAYDKGTYDRILPEIARAIQTGKMHFDIAFLTTEGKIATAIRRSGTAHVMLEYVTESATLAKLYRANEKESSDEFIVGHSLGTARMWAVAYEKAQDRLKADRRIFYMGPVTPTLTIETNRKPRTAYTYPPAYQPLVAQLR